MSVICGWGGENVRSVPKPVNGFWAFVSKFARFLVFPLDERTRTATDSTPPGPKIDYPSANSPWANPVRWVALAVVIALVVPLAIARGLQPATAGLGTHQQLGLPPCSARILFGIRCPACGMTTSWAHFTRGDWVASGRANAGGLSLALFSVVLVGLGCRSAWSGIPPAPRTQRWLMQSLLAAAVVTAIDWAYRLF